MTSIYDGDIALVSTADGADLTFENGQGRMDAGLYTAVYAAMFTRRGWWGNRVVDEDEQLGSRIDELLERNLTNRVRLDFIEEARTALAWLVTEGIAESVEVDASIVAPGVLAAEITVAQPGEETPATLRYRLNWDALRSQL